MKSANILKEIVYNDEKPEITVLFETATTKEIRIVFKKDQHMKKHQTAFPITVEMVDGNLDFGVEGTVHHLVKGDILSLDGDVPHDLQSKSNCIVRLTLSKSDTIQRVKDVINS